MFLLTYLLQIQCFKCHACPPSWTVSLDTVAMYPNQEPKYIPSSSYLLPSPSLPPSLPISVPYFPPSFLPSSLNALLLKIL